MFIQTENTPNPSTLKFIPGQTVLEKGSLEFKSSEEAKAHKLAEELFSTGNVTNVFVGKDFISITKIEKVEWDLDNLSALKTDCGLCIGFFGSHLCLNSDRIVVPIVVCIQLSQLRIKKIEWHSKNDDLMYSMRITLNDGT